MLKEKLKMIEKKLRDCESARLFLYKELVDINNLLKLDYPIERLNENKVFYYENCKFNKTLEIKQSSDEYIESIKSKFNLELHLIYSGIDLNYFYYDFGNASFEPNKDYILFAVYKENQLDVKIHERKIERFFYFEI